MCYLTFKSKQVLQKHELLSHVKIPQAEENMFKCNFCDSVCSDENTIIQNNNNEYSLKLFGVLNTTVVANSSLRRGTCQSRDLLQ